MEESIEIAGRTIAEVSGSREELLELKDLIEEVTDLAYKGRKKHLIADLAEVIEKSTCNCEHVLCSELIELAENWLNEKLESVQTARDFVDAVDTATADDFIEAVDADDWSGNSSCDRSPVEQVTAAHCRTH